MINIGYNNYLNENMILSIVNPDAAPIKRLVQNAKDEGKCIDATSGKKCKCVIVTVGERIVLSSLLTDTIAKRMNHNDFKEEGDI